MTGDRSRGPFDAVVIGGGHNALTAAVVLARAGKRVVVLERRDVFGGVAAGETFGDGEHSFRTRGVLDDSCRVRPSIVDELELGKHGLTWSPRPPLFGARKGGKGLLLSPESGADTLGASASGYRTLRSFIRKLEAPVRRLMEAPPPDIGDDAKITPLIRPAFDFRRLGGRDLMELLRVAPACVDDWVTEEVSEPLLRAMLCAEGLAGTYMGPRSPTSTTTLILSEILADREVDGGPAALVDALVAAARDAGVVLHTGIEATRIRVKNGGVTGVEIRDGEAFEAPIVLSGIGPRRTMLDLLHPLDLPAAVERDVSDIRVRGTLAKIHLGLREPLRFEGDGEPRERLLVGAEDPLDLERAFDHAKHRRLPMDPTPPLHIRQWRTDAGWVASISLHCAAHDLDGGWTEEARRGLHHAALATLEGYVPGVRGSVLATQTVTPADLESDWGLEGGCAYHGEHALDQLGPLRPTPRLARYSTPIRGLHLGCSGMHPGFGITCGPGFLAARTALTR